MKNSIKHMETDGLQLTTEKQIEAQQQQQQLQNDFSHENHKYSSNDLQKTITKVLDYMGKYQYAIFFAIAFNGLIYGINHTLTSFHIYTPTFYCKENNNTPNSCENLPDGTCPSGFQFNDDDHTIVTEWSLVCGRRLLAPMVNTFYFSGVTLGAFICGILSDKYGRKTMLIICLFSQGTLGILLRFSHFLPIFTVMRMMQGFFVQGLQGSCIALLLEYCPPRLRTIAGITWYIHYTSGLIYLGLISYAFRDWKLLQIMLAIPTIIIACYAWALPESISWLYATNRERQALQQCIKTARLNGDKTLASDLKENLLQRLNEKENGVDANIKKSSDGNDEEIDEPEVVRKASLLDVWNTPCLRKHLLVMIFVNYSIAASYFGTVYFLNNVSGNRHLNFVIGAGVELIGLIFVFLTLTYLGRRWSIIFYQFATAFLCATISFIIVFAPIDCNWKPATVTILSLTAKAVALCAFCTMSIYTTELFPTICRGSAFGTCGFWARVGSISAPFLMILAEYVSPILPMGILCVALLIAGSTSFMLPETVNKVLPNTLEDAEEMWGVKGKCENFEQ